jgi:hypothetical protein
MRSIAITTLWLMASGLLASQAFAQSPFTEHTLRLDEGKQPGTANLSEFARLVGRWIGTG